MQRVVVALSLLIGCADPGPSAPPPGATCSDGGSDERVLVARSLRFGREEPEGVSPGFDLDGDVTSAGAASGCGVADLTGPDGAQGIDNALASVLPVLELTEAGVLEPLIQDSINNGALLMMASLGMLSRSALEHGDDCVDVSVFKGVGQPMIGSDGHILPNQTLRVDPASSGNEDPEATLADGYLDAGPIDLVALPIQVLDLNDTLELFDVRLGLQAQGDGTWSGLLSGGLEVQQLIDTASLQNVDPVVVELVGPVLQRLADLAPDASGVCHQISAVFEVEMVPAFVYDGQ
ncbi:MAG TPA: hypothetical protein PKA64_24720 [Myxococcota bacterium]|nr:hypothetical protein [Myxococcota bacterium]